jgi:flagellar assembly protein FliH
MSEFVAGFASRHAMAAEILQQAFAPPVDLGFAPADIRDRAAGRRPKSFEPEGASPKHFEPADPDANPTEGWDPLTAAQDETGFVDPIAAARAQGYADGLHAAHEEIAADSARNEALLTELAAALNSAGQIDRDAMALQLRKTVMLLVTKLVGETGISGDLLATRIKAAVDMLADAAESALLRVHPDDVALLEGKLPTAIFPVGDALVTRGTFVLESASTIVEDGPDLWLDQLAEAIERAAIPPSC